MRCPKCWTEMQLTTSHTHTANCRFCKGAWLDRAVIHKQIVKAERLYRALSAGGCKPSELPCPSCGEAAPLVVSRFETSPIELDWCQSCQGVFFDLHELPTLRDSALMAEAPQPPDPERYSELGSAIDGAELGLDIGLDIVETLFEIFTD